MRHAPEFKGLRKGELAGLAYEMYTAEAHRKDSMAMPKEDRSISRAMDLFGNNARQCSEAEFCARKGVKCQLNLLA